MQHQMKSVRCTDVRGQRTLQGPFTPETRKTNQSPCFILPVMVAKGNSTLFPISPQSNERVECVPLYTVNIADSQSDSSSHLEYRVEHYQLQCDWSQGLTAPPFSPEGCIVGGVTGLQELEMLIQLDCTISSTHFKNRPQSPISFPFPSNHIVVSTGGGIPGVIPLPQTVS